MSAAVTPRVSRLRRTADESAATYAARVAGDDAALTELVDAIRTIATAQPGAVFVAIDGRSGAGKSTLAALARDALVDCVVIEGDEFYAGGSDAYWDASSPADKVAHVIDWRRQRRALQALAAGDVARWHGYDWDAFDGRLATVATTCAPAAVVILEGAYSARPELADLLHLRVLLDTPDAVRDARLRAREGDDYFDAWTTRWAEAEVHYFGRVMPRTAFDLVL
jgi:uridine kinase